MMRVTYPDLLRKIDAYSIHRGGGKPSAAKTRSWLNAPLPAGRVEEVEELIGVGLPDQYRWFVTEVGDGGAGPEGGVLPLARLLRRKVDRNRLVRLAEPFPAPTTVAEMRQVGFDPPGVLVIGEIGCGGTFRLVLAGPQRGYVWVQNPEGDWSPELADESSLPAYSDDAGPDAIFAAALAAPAETRVGFVDWYAKWLDEVLQATR
jgi:hypothetical protein